MKYLNKILIITYETDNGPYSIHYELFDTPYTQQWLDLWQNDYKDSKILTWFINNNPNELNSLVDECNSLVDQLNKEECFDLPSLSLENVQTTLNFLHYEFESKLNEIGEKSLALKLNHVIHNIESILDGLKAKKLNYLSVIYPENMSVSIPLLPEYKLFAVNYTEWGDLVLGYATTGKNWFDAIRDQDNDLINRHGISNKKEIFPEFYCTFYYQEKTRFHLSHLKHVESNAFLYQEYNKLDEYTKSNVPIGDLNELSFGKLLLGHIDYSHFCMIENLDKDKFLNDIHYRKSKIKEWNLTKFTTFKKCISFKLIDSLKK